MTGDDILCYLKDKDIHVTSCSLLTKYEEARSLSFKIVVKAKDVDKIKDPNTWPVGIGVRNYIAPKQAKLTSNMTNRNSRTVKKKVRFNEKHDKAISEKKQFIQRPVNMPGYWSNKYVPESSLALHQNKVQENTAQNNLPRRQNELYPPRPVNRPSYNSYAQVVQNNNQYDRRFLNFHPDLDRKVTHLDRIAANTFIHN